MMIRRHHDLFPQFWKWNAAAVDSATATGEIVTRFGWRMRIFPDFRPNTICNFPVQGNGAEMLRIACIMLREAGIRVRAPVHDALLIEDTVDRIDHTVQRAQQIMEAASRTILDGFTIRVESKVFKYPETYRDGKRGADRA